MLILRYYLFNVNQGGRTLSFRSTAAGLPGALAQQESKDIQTIFKMLNQILRTRHWEYVSNPNILIDLQSRANGTNIVLQKIFSSKLMFPDRSRFHWCLSLQGMYNLRNSSLIEPAISNVTPVGISYKHEMEFGHQNHGVSQLNRQHPTVKDTWFIQNSYGTFSGETR